MTAAGKDAALQARLALQQQQQVVMDSWLQFLQVHDDHLPGPGVHPPILQLFQTFESSLR